MMWKFFQQNDDDEEEYYAADRDIWIPMGAAGADMVLYSVAYQLLFPIAFKLSAEGEHTVQRNLIM